MDFLSLSLSDRADLLWSEGKHLTSADYYGHTINLYSFRGTFIEAWYNKITNEIEDIKPLSKPKLFRKYINQN